MQEIKDDGKTPSPPKKPLIFYYAIALVVLMLLNVFFFPTVLERQVVEVPYSQFLSMVDADRVTEVALDEDSREIVFIGTDESAGRATTRPVSGRTTASGCWVSCGRTRTSCSPLRSPPRPTPSWPSW